MRMRSIALVMLLAFAAALSAARAEAFCGFYVSGADAELFNNATMVALMRDGKRTVLSMQNNYQGPPENFAMVVPVPTVLQEENVKTLPNEVFKRLDQLAAPRLVEYWEQDPCMPQVAFKGRGGPPGAPRRVTSKSVKPKEDLGVKIEAQFTVGEYEIVILSAQDSTGLDTWLKREGYKIPDGAEPLLRPYVQDGMKFFVAKVDVAKVTIKNGMAMLSPLRFHYDDDKFRLPVRLGLMNAKDKQDLIVHILAKNQRYEVANYDNVTIPTNIDVADDVREQFGSFYAALFDETLAKNPKAVVTEYSWNANTCDPCPVPALSSVELATLGGDALPDAKEQPDSAKGRRWRPSGFVLTRLHARYARDTLGDDLVFRQAGPIVGGREHLSEGKLEHGSSTGQFNNFQGRYAIRHKWTGKVECENPTYGIWGGPPDGQQRKGTQAATDLAFVPRGAVKLASAVRSDVPELGITAGADVPPPKTGGEPLMPPKANGPPSTPTPSAGCGCRTTPIDGLPTTSLVLLLLLGAAAARRRYTE